MCCSLGSKTMERTKKWVEIAWALNCNVRTGCKNTVGSMMTTHKAPTCSDVSIPALIAPHGDQDRANVQRMSWSQQLQPCCDPFDPAEHVLSIPEQSRAYFSFHLMVSIPKTNKNHKNQVRYVSSCSSFSHQVAASDLVQLKQQRSLLPTAPSVLPLQQAEWPPPVCPVIYPRV